VIKDDGIELSDIQHFRRRQVVTFVRGTQPTAPVGGESDCDPSGSERGASGSQARARRREKLGEGTTPALSPDGSIVAYAKDGQIFRYTLAERRARQGSAGQPRKGRTGRRAGQAGRGSSPWIKSGTNGNLKWSPDGSKIAFVSNRGGSLAIGIYVRAQTRGEVPRAERRPHTEPHLVADSGARRFHPSPGTPFGQQALKAQAALGIRTARRTNPLNALRGWTRLGEGGRGQGGPRWSRSARFDG